jgi:hypothetical protein
MNTMSRSRETMVALLVVIALALFARLLVLPFSTTDSGDIAMRTWMAWRWLSDPEFITYGPLGPLHFYLIGATLALAPDPLYAPMGLHIIFGLMAPSLIYLFTKEEFSSSRAALLVAAMYALYPVAIRNSMTVRSETIFVVFMLASMWLLAIARSNRGLPIHAAGAGLALTLSAMLRFEGWMLIPFLGVSLWRKPKLMLLFGAIAMIHPVIWMIGNWMEFGNPLYSINWTSDFELEAMGKADRPFASLAVSAVTFAVQTLRGMNLLVGIVAVAGAVIALVTRDRARVWLVPLVGVSSLLMISIVRGSLAPKLPYTLTLGTMLLPFAALVFRQVGIESWSARQYLGSTLALLGTIAILSGFVSWERIRTGPFEGLTISSASRILTVSSVPQFENQAIALSLPNVISEMLEGVDEGLISDFYGWSATGYVALRTRLHPDRIFTAPGAPNRDLDVGSLSEFLKAYPEGVIVLLTGSRFAKAIGLTAAGQAKIGDRSLALQLVHSVQWPATGEDPNDRSLEIFRYHAEAS